MTVTDAAGKIVRTLSGPGTPGLHHVQWDLETDAAKAALAAEARRWRTGGDRSAVTLLGAPAPAPRGAGHLHGDADGRRDHPQPARHRDGGGP